MNLSRVLTFVERGRLRERLKSQARNSGDPVRFWEKKIDYVNRVWPEDELGILDLCVNQREKAIKEAMKRGRRENFVD